MSGTPKYPSSRRTGDAGETKSPRAPQNFQAPMRVKVEETIAPLPSAKKVIDCDSISSKILNESFFDTLPQTYRESEVEPEVIKEEKQEYVYQVPAGYEHIKPIIEQKKPVGDYVSELETRLERLADTSYEGIDKLMKAISIKHAISPKKLHDDFKAKNKMIPDQWIDEQKPKEKPKTVVEQMAESLKFTKKEELTEEQKADDRDKKIAKLEQELINLRKITLETAQGTIVHGLGQGTGSGEVRINRMDDVDSRGILDGAVLVWDSTLNKWLPSLIGGESGIEGGVTLPGGNQDLENKISNLEQVITSLQQFVQEHVGDGEFHPNAPIDDQHDHVGMLEMLTMEASTDDSAARPVIAGDDSVAYIISEQSVDLDHTHYIEDGLLLIQVEGATEFTLSNHEHDPVWVEMETYSDFYGVKRTIDWTDNTTLLLRLEDADHFHADHEPDHIIVELEDGTLTSTSETATIFGIEISTDTSAATTFDWNDDVNLVSPEGVNNPQDLSSAGDGTFIGLEDNVTGHEQVTVNIPSVPEGGSKFFDVTPGGDVNRFRVTIDSSRGVYELDGIAQPAIQIPRGDIIEFDLIAIEERDAFTIYANGSEVDSLERFPTMVSFDSSKIDPTINKAYYRHTTKRGMGWLIVITDN